MSSLKFLSVAALVAVLLSGPALAQDAVSPVEDASTVVASEVAKPVKAKIKHAKKHKIKAMAKKHHKKASGDVAVGQ